MKNENNLFPIFGGRAQIEWGSESMMNQARLAFKKKEYEKSLHLFQKVASGASGLQSEALFWIAHHYENGLGTDKSNNKASGYYRQVILLNAKETQKWLKKFLRSS